MTPLHTFRIAVRDATLGHVTRCGHQIRFRLNPYGSEFFAGTSEKMLREITKRIRSTVKAWDWRYIEVELMDWQIKVTYVQ